MQRHKILFFSLVLMLGTQQINANWFSDTANSIGTSIWNQLPETFQKSPTLQKWACWLGIGAACYVGARLALKVIYEDEDFVENGAENMEQKATSTADETIEQKITPTEEPKANKAIIIEEKTKHD